MEKKRDLLVDQLKGYACFLVAFGHVIMGIRRAGIVTPVFMQLLEAFIWTFHVPLFMFLSGYVFKITGGWRSKGGRIEFILHKLLNLGVPYLVFSTLYIAINSFIPGVNNQNSLVEILYLWKNPTAQYWFLYALFFLFVIWTCLSSGSIKNNVILTIGCTILASVANMLEINLGCLQSALSMSLAFGVGTCMPDMSTIQWKYKSRLIIILLHLTIVFGLILIELNDLWIVEKMIEILGIFSSIAFISLIVKNNAISGILLWVNRYSFPIYLLHTIFTAGIRLILIKFGVSCYVFHVFIGTIMAIVAPYICMRIAERRVCLTFLFYPSKALKIAKSLRS